MKGELVQGAVYQSDNADSGRLPPFTDYVFYVLETLSAGERDPVSGLESGPRARILVLEGDDRIFPTASIHTIGPAYWIWSGAWRIA